MSKNAIKCQQMPENSRKFQKMPEMPENARKCQKMSENARNARKCQKGIQHDYTRVQVSKNFDGP